MRDTWIFTFQTGRTLRTSNSLMEIRMEHLGANSMLYPDQGISLNSLSRFFTT